MTWKKVLPTLQKQGDKRGGRIFFFRRLSHISLPWRWKQHAPPSKVGKYIYQTVWSHARRRYYDSYPPPREPTTYTINIITKCSLSIQSYIDPHFERHADSFHLCLRPSVGNTVGERWITCHVSHLIRLQATLESFADHLLPMTPSLTHKIIKTNQHNLRRALNLHSACLSWNFAIPLASHQYVHNTT